MYENLISFIRKNKLITILFAFSLIFFIYQHSSGFSWDFAVYSLNAQYMLHNGHFMEWSRPPLAGFMLGIFGILGMSLAEHIFIIFVSVLFLYSSLRFSGSLKIDSTAYYVFAMNAAVIILGFQAGTELLSLALLQLFISELHTRRSGLFLGLSLLLRYNSIIYLPLLLFKKRFKGIILAIFVIFILFLPWLAYNFILTGSAFSSFIDFYLLNIKFREASVSFSITDLIVMLGTALPFFIYGVYKTKSSLNDKIMIFVFAITLVSYSLIALKYTRYLFAAMMPAAYFASKAMGKVKKKEIILWTLALVNISLVLAAVFFVPATLNEGDYYYKLAAKGRCLGVSNAWIPVNYYGGYAEPTVSNNIEGELIETNASREILAGKRIILFRNVPEPSYYNETLLFPIIEENQLYTIYGDTCILSDKKIDEAFSERLGSLR